MMDDDEILVAVTVELPPVTIEIYASPDDSPEELLTKTIGYLTDTVKSVQDLSLEDALYIRHKVV